MLLWKKIKIKNKGGWGVGGMFLISLSRCVPVCASATQNTDLLCQLEVKITKTKPVHVYEARELTKGQKENRLQKKGFLKRS